jgi:hypothetical protein
MSKRKYSSVFIEQVESIINDCLEEIREKLLEEVDYIAKQFVEEAKGRALAEERAAKRERFAHGMDEIAEFLGCSRNVASQKLKGFLREASYSCGRIVFLDKQKAWELMNHENQFNKLRRKKR